MLPMTTDLKVIQGGRPETLTRLAERRIKQTQVIARTGWSRPSSPSGGQRESISPQIDSPVIE